MAYMKDTYAKIFTVILLEGRNHELIIYNKSLSLYLSLYILPIGSDSLERSLVPYVILWEELWTH